MKIRSAKLSVLFFAILLFCILNGNIYAQKGTGSKIPTLTASKTKISTPSATISDKDTLDKLKQIELLKEKIATKVAEIRNKEKGVLFGTIKKIEDTQVTLITKVGEKNFKWAEDTLFYTFRNQTRSEFDPKKFKEGNQIAALGYFNDTKDVFSAKYIYLTEKPIRILGKVADKDSQNFTITVKDREGQKIIDIEKYTSTIIYTKGKSAAKAGFSKINIGDTAIVLGSINSKAENRFFANKILIIQLESPLSITPTPSLAKKVSPTPSPEP